MYINMYLATYFKLCRCHPI